MANKRITVESVIVVIGESGGKGGYWLNGGGVFEEGFNTADAAARAIELHERLSSRRLKHSHRRTCRHAP